MAQYSLTERSILVPTEIISQSARRVVRPAFKRSLSFLIVLAVCFFGFFIYSPYEAAVKALARQAINQTIYIQQNLYIHQHLMVRTIEKTTQATDNNTQTASTLPSLTALQKPSPPKSYYDFPFEWKESVIDFANLHLIYNLSRPLNASICHSIDYFIFMPTRPSAFATRNAIRNTWAKHPLPAGMLTRFVIGRPNTTAAEVGIYDKLLKELETFGDLIIYDAPDTYRKLHIKVYAVLTWQQAFCPKAKFIIRADTDTVVDLSRLNYWLGNGLIELQKENMPIVFGLLDLNAEIQRNSSHRQYISYTDYASDQPPPYVWGFFYIFSNEAVRDVLRVSHSVNGFSLDDVLYTGVLAQKAGVRLEDISKHLKIWKRNIQEGRNKCEGKDNMPLLTAYCCVSNPAELAANYEYIHSVKCNDTT